MIDDNAEDFVSYIATQGGSVLDGKPEPPRRRLGAALHEPLQGH